jgi:hypothetical protein
MCVSRSDRCVTTDGVWIGELLTTYTNQSELQPLKTVLLISTHYK